MIDDAIVTFKTMVLNMGLDSGEMTPKQIDYVLKWVDKNVPKVYFNKLSEIAWQYDQNLLSAKLEDLYKQFMHDD